MPEAIDTIFGDFRVLLINKRQELKADSERIDELLGLLGQRGAEAIAPTQPSFQRSTGNAEVPRGRRTFTAEQRQQLSDRMKKAWRKRKRAQGK